MKFKALLAAAAAVTILPMGASAALVQNCDASGAQIGPAPYDITSGDVYNCDFNTFDASGSVQLDFVASSTPAAGVAFNTNLSGGNSLDSATVAWWEASSDGTLLSLIESVDANLNGGATSLATLFDGDAPDYQSVVFTWAGFDSTGTGLPLDIQVQVVPSAVPVPAGILLMGTALAGFGVMRRRKKAA